MTEPIGELNFARSPVIVPEISGNGLARGPARHPRTEVEYIPRPKPVGARDREPWRVAALLLALSFSRAQTASIEQLHVLMAVLSDDRVAERVLAQWRAPGEPAEGPVRYYDRRMVATVAISVAAGYAEQLTNASIKLTTAGRTASGELIEIGAFQREASLLASLQPINATEMWRRLGTPSPSRPAP